MCGATARRLGGHVVCDDRRAVREVVAAERRGATRLPDLLPAAELLPGGARARGGRGGVFAAEIAP